MSELSITIVDAFTREPGVGNRAGIVLDAPELECRGDDRDRPGGRRLGNGIRASRL